MQFDVVVVESVERLVSELNIALKDNSQKLTTLSTIVETNNPNGAETQQQPSSAQLSPHTSTI